MQRKVQLRIGLLAAGVMLAGGMLSPRPAQAQEPTSIKVGWAISKTGPMWAERRSRCSMPTSCGSRM